MKELIKGLRQFKTSYFCRHQELFAQLAHGQHPRVLFITCSDSRIDPNLLTQTQPGDLFVIRNAGNIIPPFGSANGGEGAAVEYAIQALNIEQVIVCGHSHCGAMKGLLKRDSLMGNMPLVYEWLGHAEATRRLVQENYSNLEGEDLLDITIAENVLTQIENLRTYPVVRSRLYQGKLKIYAWIYDIDSGEVSAYDPELHAYMPPHTQLPTSEIDPEMLVPITSCEINPGSPPSPKPAVAQPAVAQPAVARSDYGDSWLPPEQAERIYRGSASTRR